MNKIIKKLFKKFRQFRKKSDSNLNLFVICIAVTMVWRWIWWLLDIYLFPDCYRLSCVTCIILWILILLADDGKIDEL